MACVDGLPAESHHSEEDCGKANTCENGGECSEGYALPSIGGVPSFVVIRGVGVGLVRRCFVSFRSVNQRNDREVLDGKENQPCQSAGRKDHQDQFSKLSHDQLSGKGSRSRGVCRERCCALA